jgi:flagellar hook protein FlgE
MDVIGNNIANVNTIGFKRSKTAFATMLSQTLSGASAPDSGNPPTFGGTNPIQVGLGMSIASIDRIMNQGAAQNTGKGTDLMIQDDGFFSVRLGSEIFYTRTGNFDFDRDGNLVEPATGGLVQGYANDPVFGDTANPGHINLRVGSDHPGPGMSAYKLTGFTIDKKGVVTGVYSDGTTSMTEQMYTIALTNFANPGGLMAVGNNFYSPSNNSGNPQVGKPGEEGRGTIIPGALEMSNVELAQEFTDMIVTQRGFQANSRVITVSDSLLQELIDLKR